MVVKGIVDQVKVETRGRIFLTKRRISVHIEDNRLRAATFVKDHTAAVRELLKIFIRQRDVLSLRVHIASPLVFLRGRIHFAILQIRQGIVDRTFFSPICCVI